MSVTLKMIYIPQKPMIAKCKYYEFMSDLYPIIVIEKDGNEITICTHIHDRFKFDGASVPKPLEWFLPRYAKTTDPIKVDDADVYNVGSAIHDGLYIHKGFGMFSREECDDILRGIWRQAGVSRFKAGFADRMIQWFAGGNKHWGNDTYKVGGRFSIDKDKGFYEVNSL